VILLTGVTGKTGGEVAKQLLARGVRFRALVRNEAKAASLKAAGADLVAGDMGDAEAAKRIRRIRGVGDAHLLTLVLRDLSEIGHFARLDNWQFRIVRLGTPGPYTFVLPATKEVPRRLQHPKRSTVGVRVPQHPVVQALLAELGEPILSSTLVLPGAAGPLVDPDAIRDALGKLVDLVLDAGPCPEEPTTVVDLAVVPPAIIRRGAGDPARLGIDLAAPD